MKQFHTKGHENSGNCACFPPLLGERAGVRASVSPTHFRSRRLITQNPKSEIQNRSEPRHLGCYERFPIFSTPCPPGGAWPWRSFLRTPVESPRHPACPGGSRSDIGR